MWSFEKFQSIQFQLQNNDVGGKVISVLKNQRLLSDKIIFESQCVRCFCSDWSPYWKVHVMCFFRWLKTA